MSEVAKAVGQWVVDNLGWSAIILLFLLSCLFKITKKEIDPLGTVVGWIGKALTKDVRQDISELQTDLDNFKKQTDSGLSEMKNGTVQNCETLKKRLDEMEAANQKSNDMQTVRQIKTHVLDFANSCMNKRKHTKLDFENIIDENTQYEELVKKYNLVNDVYKEDFSFIMKVYHKCQEEGSFLKESDVAS